MIIGSHLCGLESTKILGQKSKYLGLNGLGSGRYCPSCFWSLVKPIRLGKFLTHELMGKMPQNLDMMLLGQNLRYGINFIKIHPYI